MSHVRLGEALLEGGWLTEGDLARAREEEARRGVGLRQILIDLEIVSESCVVDVLANTLGMNRLDIPTANVSQDVRGIVDATWAIEHEIVPIRITPKAGRLVVVVVDPQALAAIDEVQRRAKRPVSVLLGTTAEVMRLIRHIYYGEPLDRSTDPADPRDVHSRPTRPPPTPRRVHSPHTRTTAPPPPQMQYPLEPIPMPEVSTLVPPDPRDLATLFGPLLARQEASAKQLRAVFERCVQKGLITREEYMARLASMLE